MYIVDLHFHVIWNIVLLCVTSIYKGTTIQIITFYKSSETFLEIAQDWLFETWDGY